VALKPAPIWLARQKEVRAHLAEREHAVAEATALTFFAARLRWAEGVWYYLPPTMSLSGPFIRAKTFLEREERI
jgi:hypothetical protein